MLTPDQMRIRLERLVEQGEACNGCLALIAVLHDVLPDLVEQAEAQRLADIDALEQRLKQRQRRDHAEGIQHVGVSKVDIENSPPFIRTLLVNKCNDCTDTESCERVRTLMGQGVMKKRDIVAAWVQFFNWRSEADRLNRLWQSGLVTREQFREIAKV